MTGLRWLGSAVLLAQLERWIARTGDEGAFEDPLVLEEMNRLEGRRRE